MLKCITRAKVPASLPDYQSSLLLALSGHCSDTAQSPLSEADIWAAKKAVNRSDTSFSRPSWFGRVSSPPAAMAMAVTPPAVTMMVIIPVVNRRTKIVLGSGFADCRHRSGERARHWSQSKKTGAKYSSRKSQFCLVHDISSTDALLRGILCRLI